MSTSDQATAPAAPQVPADAGVPAPGGGHITTVYRIGAELPDRAAVVFEAPDGARTELTYGELAAAADRYAVALQRRGAGVGDAISVLLPNCAEFLACYLGAMQIGVYIAPINWHLSGPEIAYIVDNSESKLLLAHERFGAAAAAAAAELRGQGNEVGLFAVGEIDGYAPVAELLSEAPAGQRPTGRTLGGPMLYTSGTTGRPKGVRRPLTGASPDQITYANYAFFAGFGIQGADNVHLCGSPLYHTAVLNFVAISLALGQRVVVMDKWTPAAMLRLATEFGVTQSHMVPTQFVRLLELPRQVREAFDPSALRVIVHGAAPTPRHVKQEMLEWWGPVLTEYYAGTEGGGATITGEEWLRKPGSVGKPWPSTELKILDDDGAELPAGEVGNVYLRMRGSTFAYHKDAEKTAKTYQGELFTMGDIGYVDPDGYLFLLDRKNDMIISGGVNIYPSEIEAALQRHPAVRDAAVFGIPNADWGEEVKAVVELTPGHELNDDTAREALAVEIIASLDGQLAKFKHPRTLDIVDALPREANGKLIKRKLKAPYWE